MPPIHPADELAEIRAEIARLRQREEELEAQLLTTPEPLAQGRWYRAEVAESHCAQVIAEALPPTIRNDPAFWQVEVRRTVTCAPVRPHPSPRPGWPMRRQSPSPLH